ncbi:MAG TPA: YegS/Rv2252/BmrU family lipid kinase [Chitinophagaceae bacterium]|nr:YegS/Rv2252/BmrU family lipid kinase [Chitinophagaceae bacterium]
MHRNILYIINPISGTKTKKNIRQWVEQKTKAANIPFAIIPSVADGDYHFLHQKIREEKITDVVIAGGDGTVNQVIGSLLKCNVRFGIIPCGSGNGMAFAAKISKQPEKALDLILQGQSKVTDSYSANEHFGCMLCGLGFDAKIAHDFVDLPKRGLKTYFKLIIKNYFSSKTFSFKITINGKSIPIDAYFISIANSNQFGNHFTIAPKASLDDGLLDVVIFTKQNKISLFFQLLKQLSGINKLQTTLDVNMNQKIIYFQTKKMKIENPAQAPFHIDGEPVATPASVDITIAEKSFFLFRQA